MADCNGKFCMKQWKTIVIYLIGIVVVTVVSKKINEEVSGRCSTPKKNHRSKCAFNMMYALANKIQAYLLLLLCIVSTEHIAFSGTRIGFSPLTWMDYLQQHNNKTNNICVRCQIFSTNYFLLITLWTEMNTKNKMRTSISDWGKENGVGDSV